MIILDRKRCAAIVNGEGYLCGLRASVTLGQLSLCEGHYVMAQVGQITAVVQNNAALQ